MKRIMFLAAFAAIAMTSCKDATMSQFKALGQKHKVELLNCNGEVTRVWHATGSVSNEANSDGWYFTDTETGKLVEVTGVIIITVE